MRLSLRVSDYDIRLVAPGATGTLALSGLSGRALPFRVTRIAEVATAADGANAFRAEATLIDPPAGLRPGLGGVARIDAGETTLGHALLRPVIARTRILLWRLWP
jgi:multidrug efflux pump subunit AcrA (membrane-fusion protein)